MPKISQTFRNQGPCIQDLTVLQNSSNKMNVHLILTHAYRRGKKTPKLNNFSERKK